jgi:two-component system response regulator HydG
MIAPGDLPPEIVRTVQGTAAEGAAILDDKVISIPLGTPLEVIEKQVIEETLKYSRGDKNVASKILGISSRTIYRKIEEEKEEEKKDVVEGGKDELP